MRDASRDLPLRSTPQLPPLDRVWATHQKARLPAREREARAHLSRPQPENQKTGAARFPPSASPQIAGPPDCFGPTAPVGENRRAQPSPAPPTSRASARRPKLSPDRVPILWSVANHLSRAA